MPLLEYYNTLGLHPGADMDEIKKAFREKAKQFHPDLNPAPNAQDEFIRVHTAYEMVVAHRNGKSNQSFAENPVSFAAAEVAMRRAAMKSRAEHYARMKYEEFVNECEAYRNSPYSWVFKILYYGLYYLYLFCAMVFAFVPLLAGYGGGIGYFFLCSPLFILSYFTVKMANGWKKEIDPLFNPMAAEKE
ncbi:MAG: J domain-containing protein [Bacteroidota bacterium]